jgi:hypothetical protein
MFNTYLHATITKSCPSTQYLFAPHQRSMFICLFSIRFFTKTLESPSCVCTIKLVYNSLWTYRHKSYMLGNLFKLWHYVKFLWYYIHYIKFANIIFILNAHLPTMKHTKQIVSLFFVSPTHHNKYQWKVITFSKNYVFTSCIFSNYLFSKYCFSPNTN